MRNIYIQTRQRKDGYNITFLDEKAPENRQSYFSNDFSNDLLKIKEELLIRFQEEIVYPYLINNNINDNINIITEPYRYKDVLEGNKDLDINDFENKRLYVNVKNIKKMKQELNNINEIISDNDVMIKLYNSLSDLDNKMTPLYFNKKSRLINSEKLVLEIFKINKDNQLYIGTSIISTINNNDFLMSKNVSLPKIPTILKDFRNLLKKHNIKDYIIKTNYKGLKDVDEFKGLNENNIIEEKSFQNKKYYLEQVNLISENREDHMLILEKYKASDILDPNTVVIYSDASRLEDRVSAGYGITVLEKGTDKISYKIKGKIDNRRNYLSSNTSELHGISQTIKFINNNKETIFKDVKKIEIRCDCLAMIQHFSGDKIQNKNDFKKVDELIKNNEIEISFKWVRGHSKDNINNITDSLAREGVYLKDYNEVVEKNEDINIKIKNKL